MAAEVTDVASSSRKGVENAIAPWWKGGGTASRLVDVLSREGATASEARQVAERLAERVAGGRDYTGAPLIGEELERIRAAASLGSHEREREKRERRDREATRGVWVDIERELRRHDSESLVPVLEGMLSGLGSQVLASQWRSILAEDWTRLTGEPNPDWLPHPVPGYAARMLAAGAQFQLDRLERLKAKGGGT